MKRFIFLLGIILIGSFESAHGLPIMGGGQAGNGGDAVVCTSNYRLKAELLDVFEGRILHKMNLNFPAYSMIGNLDRYQLVQANAHILAKRIEGLSPLLAKRYHGYINSFFEETNFVSGVELPDIPDSNGVIIPVDCKISQLIIQISDGSYGNKRYIINQDIWNLLDDANKATALFHEVIYRLAIETGQSDSRWTRYFNAIVFSDRISKLNAEQFSDVRKQAYVSRFSYKGFELAGKMNPDQKLYQVVTAPTTETFGLKLDDGIYDMENDYLVEAHFGDPTTQFKELTFPKGLGMTFGARGIFDQIYFSEVSETQFGIRIIPPTADQCSRWSGYTDRFLQFCSIMSLKWNSATNDFQVQVSGGKYAKNKVLIPFDNNVRVFFEFDSSIRFAEGMNKETMISQFCDSSGTCPEAFINYSNGQLVAGYNDSPVDNIQLRKAEVQLNGSDFLRYSSFDRTRISYKIPTSFGGDLATVKKIFETDSVKFNHLGDYSFVSSIYVYSGTRKLVRKDGSILELVTGDYEFTFDKDGFLLSANLK